MVLLVFARLRKAPLKILQPLIQLGPEAMMKAGLTIF
jgi:hypothetical protein